MNLYDIRNEINEIILKKQKELQLTFDEETHSYTMVDENGNIKNNFVKKYQLHLYQQYN